jgi:hypothetical protein
MIYIKKYIIERNTYFFFFIEKEAKRILLYNAKGVSFYWRGTKIYDFPFRFPFLIGLS